MGQSQSADPQVPKTMRRLVLTTPSRNIEEIVLTIEEVDVPTPKSGEVLIKVVAAPVNPSDYGNWMMAKKEDCPKAIGNEGSGVVVASGGGFGTPAVGTQVGFVGLEHGQGSYSEYVVASSQKGTYPMPNSLPIEDAASFFVNPYTAIGILDTVRSTGSKSFIHTAAASQLGQMIVKLAKEDGDLTVLNVVRREEQAELLRSIGAEHVVVTGTDGWREELKTLMKAHKCRVAFDAIAGTSTGELMELLPPKGELFVYGGLGGAIQNVNPIQLIYANKKLKGWLLPRWLQSGGLPKMLLRVRSATSRVSSGLASGGWSSSNFKDTTLESMHGDFVAFQKAGVTGEKLRIRFDGSPAAGTGVEEETQA